MNAVRESKSGERRWDWPTTVMGIAAIAALAGSLWYAWGKPGIKPIVVGSLAPPLRIKDLETGEPAILAGARGRIVWIVFWSVDDADSSGELAAAGKAWERLADRGRFVPVLLERSNAAADRVRQTSKSAGFSGPIQRADRSLLDAYRARSSPRMVLIDQSGRVIAIESRIDRESAERFTREVLRRLDELDPLGGKRFA